MVQKRENGFDTYRVAGDNFILANKFRATQQIRPDVYKIMVNSRTGEMIFQPLPIISDGLVELPDTVSDQVQREIDDFLTEETRAAFERYDFLYKRGILLYGAPGTGKTIIVQKIMERVVRDGGVVLFNPAPYSVSGFVHGIRDVEPDKHIMIVWEDLDDWLDDYETEILAVLDGEERMDNVIFMATTNYILQIPQRITNRPSRFASVIEVGLPNAKARKLFLTAKLHADDDVDLDTWVEKTDGLTIDHLKDLIISVMCFKVPLNDAVDKLQRMGPVDKNEEDYDEDEDYD